VPESWISHTDVTGGSFFCGACEELGVVLVFGSEALLEPGVVAAALLGVLAGAEALLAAGASAADGSGALELAAGVAAAAARSRAAIAASTSGRRLASEAASEPAKELSGPGPTAAPTATPIPSIAAASMALQRARGTRTSRGGRAVACAAGEGSVVVSSMSVSRWARPCAAPASVPAGIAHNLAYPDLIYRDYGMLHDRSCQQARTESLQMNRIRRISAAIVAVGVLGVAAPAAASASTTITISGATASYPLVSLLASKYHKLHSSIRFRIAQGGSQVGVNDVAGGRVSVGDVSRDPESKDPAGLVFYPIAKYGICVVTNKANALANLTSSQLQAIFTGKTRTWSSVPGAGASGSIDLISRTSVAGVLTSFQTLLLEGKKVSTLAAEEPSEGLLKQQVENDPNSIGFISNYQSDKGGVNVVGLNGVQCNRSNALSGQYGGVARFYEVTKGKASGAASQFIGWIEKSAAAKSIINTQWISIS
jgi:phosphate transport system substrate-binding protein